MKSLLLASVAAVSLFAVTDAALAQGANPGGMKETPPAAAQKSDAAPTTAPAPKGSVMPAAPAAPKSGAVEDKAPKGSVTQSGPAAPKSGAVVEDKIAPKNSPQQAQDKAAPKAGDVKTDSKPAAAATNPAVNTTAKDSKPSTTGAATSGSTAAPPAEKRTQIVSAIKQEKIEEVTNVNFTISIGTTVPSTVRYYPLPSRIVEIYPDWSGYDFILVRGQYIILRARTHEIVYIIEG